MSDDNPALEPANPLDALALAALRTSAAYQRAVATAEAEREAAETRETEQALRTTLARVAEVTAEQARKRAALPCYPAHREHDLTAAVRCCNATGARAACEFARFDDCPQRLVAAPREAVLARLEAGRVPSSPEKDRDGTREILAAWVPPTNTPPRETLALAAVRLYVGLDVAPWALVLSGGVGVGKTIAACWAIGEGGGFYVQAPELALLADEDAGGMSAREVQRRARDTRLLVLDDLGTEHVGAAGYAASKIGELLCARYEGRRRTILTTNLNPLDLKSRYSERVWDRLRDGARIVELPAGSLRGAP